MPILELASALADLLLKLLGKEEAKKLLDDRAIEIANAAADAAERAKFGDDNGG
jgi:hypothetical protein